MTDKEYEQLWRVILLIAGLILGFATGGLVTSLRYDSDIRTDQVELKKDVAEIKIDKATVEEIVKVFLFETEQVKLESQRLRDLQIRLSGGESNNNIQNVPYSEGITGIIK